MRSGRIYLPGPRTKPPLGALCALALLAVSGCRSEPLLEQPYQPLSSALTVLRLEDAQAAPCSPPSTEFDRLDMPAAAGPALALLAVASGADTSLVWLTPDETLPMGSPRVLGEVQALGAGSVLAYEVLPGLDPKENYLEVADLSGGHAWQVRPGPGCALAGFVMSPAADQVAFVQTSMRGSLRSVGWTLNIVDLRTGRVDSWGPQQASNFILHPVGWSASTGELLLHARDAFGSSGGRGVWAMSTNPPVLSQLLKEQDFVGTPTLSPDGRHLAYLASEPDLTEPRARFGPSEPPANQLLLMDLSQRTGQLLAEEPDHIYRGLAWVPQGTAFAFQRGAWSEELGAYLFNQLLTIDLADSMPRLIFASPDELLAAQPCSVDSFYVSSRTNLGTQLLSVSAGGAAESSALQGADGAEILACGWGIEPEAGT